jgi:hypothetical protein
MGQYAKAAAYAVQIGSSVMGGQSGKKAGAAAASAEIADSQQRARLIRKLARDYHGQATAAYAASGVDVSQGTPMIVDRQIEYDSELDALNEIVSGKRRARALRAGGAVSQQAGYLQGAGTALSAWADFRTNGWRT